MRFICFRSIAILVFVQMIFPPSIFASSKRENQRTVVIVSVRDNVSDNISEDLVGSFSKALVLQGLQVVSKEKVSAVVDYHTHEKAKEEESGEAENALIRGKEHYYNFDYAEGMAQVSRAISLMEANPKDISEHGLLLRDAYITAGIIEKSEKGRDPFVREYFKKALEVDPQYELEEKAFAPSVVSLFAEARAGVSRRPVGSVSVDTDPKVAEVYVNGILKGVTPIVVSGLPAATYHVAIKTNKYKPVEKEVAVAGGEIFKMKEKLLWSEVSEPKKPVVYNLLNSPNEAREQIAEGVRISELLRVPKVIMIDADEKENGSGEIAIRMIDRKYRSGHNPIIVSYKKDKRSLEHDLGEAALLLVKQSEVAILDNPTKNLDPDGIGDPVLLGKRGKKALLAVPTFWAIVGGIAAATAGGAAAAVALTSGGDSSSASGTGNVNVQFK